MGAEVGSLLEKRRELMARRRSLKGELTRIAADIAAIDRVMRMVDEDYRPEPPNRLPSGRPTAAGNPFKAGEMVVAMLDALRTVGRPVRSTECAEAMLSKVGHPADDATLAGVANRVSAVLAQKVQSGQVERAGNGTGRQVLWRIAA